MHRSWLILHLHEETQIIHTLATVILSPNVVQDDPRLLTLLPALPARVLGSQVSTTWLIYEMLGMSPVLCIHQASTLPIKLHPQPWLIEHRIFQQSPGARVKASGGLRSFALES